MKLLLTILPFIGCVTAMGKSPILKDNNPNLSAEASKVTIQSMLKNIWNNGGEQTTENYKYNVGYGRLIWGDKDVQGFFPATKSNVSEGNFDGSGGPIVDWGGDRLFNTVANEMFMFKIKAINDIEIKFGGDGEGALAGWLADSQLNFYVIEGDIENGRWYQDKLTKSLNMTAATTYADISHTATVKAGNTFVFEWGAHESSGRNWQNFAKMYFEFKELLAEDTLPMSSIVTNVISSAGQDVQKSTVNYNVKHGSVGDKEINNFDTFDGSLSTTSGNAIAQNWKIYSQNRDGIIFLFNVKKYSTFSVWREELGTGNEWLENAKINIYVNDDLVSEVTIASDNPDLSIFSYNQDVKIGDVVAWEFLYEWDPHRSMAMLNGGDIVTSLPQFKFSEIEHTHSWSELGNGKAATCEENGWKDYSSCECGLYAEDAEGTSIIGDIHALNEWKSGDGKIQASGHEYGVATYVWSSDNLKCTASHTCSKCLEVEYEEVETVVTHITPVSCKHDGEDKIDAIFTKTGFESQTKTVIIPQLEHKVVLVSGQPATCEEDGWKDYYTCNGCHCCYEDPDGLIEIDDIAAWKLGDGKLNKTGHEFSEVEYVWSEDNSTCTASRHCIHEGCTKSETEIGTSSYEHISSPTCSEDGLDRYSVTFTNTAFEPQTKDIILHKLGHELVHFDGEEATCSKPGFKDYYKCNRCNEYFEDEDGTKKISDLEQWKQNEGKILPLKHDLLLIRGVSATCTTGGYKDYYKCLVCNEYFEDKDGTKKISDLEQWKQNEGKLEPTGHEYGEIKYVWSDDNSSCTASRQCIHEGCIEIETETVQTYKRDGKIYATFKNPAFAEQCKDEPKNIGLIVGLSVGGGVLLIGGGVATFLIIRKKRRLVK